MICKLCLEDKPLLRRSHIIPDFMYQDIYDENHWIHRGRPSEPSRRGRVPTGEYEGNILCKPCDNEIIGNYESYGSRALYGGELPIAESPIFEQVVTPAGQRITVCRNIDYRKFKLFLLSILWRASISDRDFFSDVNLGGHEDTIRGMLFGGYAREPNIYPILLATYLGDIETPADVIGQPHRFRLDRSIGYNFLIGGTYYIFFISRSGIPAYVLDASISPSNEMKIIHLSGDDSGRLLHQYFAMSGK